MFNNVSADSFSVKGPPYEHCREAPYVGLKNTGNTCFLAASTNFVLGIEEIAQLVSLKYHNSFCAKVNCFLCAWETLAFDMLQNTGQDDPLSPSTVANQYANLNPYYRLASVFDASGVVGAIVDGYEKRVEPTKPDKCADQYLEYVTSIL